MSALTTATEGGQNDQVHRCCWICVSTRYIGASNDACTYLQPDGMTTQIAFGCGPFRTRSPGSAWPGPPSATRPLVWRLLPPLALLLSSGRLKPLRISMGH